MDDVRESDSLERAEKEIKALQATAALTLSSVTALLFGAVGYFEYYDLLIAEQCDIEPQRTLTIAACCVVGASFIVCCDACKSIRRSEKEYEHIIQLKQMGTKKNE